MSRRFGKWKGIESLGSAAELNGHIVGYEKQPQNQLLQAAAILFKALKVLLKGCLMNHFGIIVTAAIAFISFGAVAETDESTAPGWITATNQPCKIWNPEPQPNESVTWSGQCKDGFASGKGISHWTEDGKADAEFDGEYVNGKRNGFGVIIAPNGERIEGEWSDDEPVPIDPNTI